MTNHSARHSFFLASIIGLSILAYTYSSSFAQQSSIKLIMPVLCQVDVDCFIQQMTDLDDTSGVIDPFCGTASYDGHKGTDIRIRSMKDIENNVPVIAAADGIVKVLRDGVADLLVKTEADRSNVKERECGNGIVLSHTDGIETQYCHMKNGSIAVKQGQPVRQGETIGFVGSSGLAQFPHLHLSVRQNGNIIDPFTGHAPGEDCTEDISDSWWAKNSPIITASHDAIILQSGISGRIVDHNELVENGSPELARSSDPVTVGWTWLANLKKGDQISMKLLGPAGFVAENTTAPLDANKAIWSGYVGKKRPPATGDYTFTVSILRGGSKIVNSEISQTVE